MATQYRAPESYPQNIGQPSIFLAGSIDMGNAIDWQQSICEKLQDLDILILNPRRLAWDKSWEQSITNPLFTEQVEWELDGLDHATYIAMFLSAQSKAPISLLELGLYAKSNRLLIACEPNFWRRGNVEVVSNRYNIPLFSSLDELIMALRERLSNPSK